MPHVNARAAHPESRLASVYPARPCQWCGASFRATDTFEDAPASGGSRSYFHTTCAAEFANAMGYRERAVAWDDAAKWDVFAEGFAAGQADARAHG